MKTNGITTFINRVVDTIKPITNKRFNVINIMILLFLVNAFIIRTILLVNYTFLFDCNPFELLKDYLGGFCYDIIAALYFVLPLTLSAFFLPKKLYRSKFHKYYAYFVFTFYVLLLVLSGIAEWYFWEEFQVRFNFIAVDYLIYTTEVVQNIIESYPLGIIIPAMFIATSVITYFCRKIIRSSLETEVAFRTRMKYGAPYLLLPVLFFITVNGSWEKLAENKYNNELAKNGIYCLFEAYINNEINYDEFYITHPNAQNFGILRHLLASSNSSYTTGNSMGIKRAITGRREEKRMNVIYICVESLSAGYIDYFGSKEGLTPNLDTLARKCIVGENYFATGTRTIRGIEALVLSIPPTPGSSVVRRKENDSLCTIGSVLQRRAYQLKFLYGGLGYFDNMNQFFGDNGFTCIDKPSFSKKEKTFSNAWGLCDEDVFN
jgi:phosphoglycerol transferase MdoB-like AlkP superfamily enzyme